MPAFRHVDLRRHADAPRDPNPGFARLYVDADGVPRVRDAGEDSALGGSSSASAVTLDPPVAGQTNVQDALAAVAGIVAGSTLLDLGVVNAVDLLDLLPHTLYTPVAGQLLILYVGPDGFVELDGGLDIAVEVAGNADIPVVRFTRATAYDQLPVVQAVGRKSITATTDPVTALLGDLTLQTWAPLTAFPDTTAIIEAGEYWEPGRDGTTGAALPDFAGNIGGSVADGSITWDDVGPVTTQGSLHLYALVATAVVP